ncbi:MAG: phosphoribosylanthranilate isomerase [Vicinamibacteria bacterium]|nr:phosphoribosylanthranilate isomerase [Vicinamibacteria bacterium]
MTWIKVCGITSVADAAAAIQAGVSAIGLVFATSPRQVTTERAREIADFARGRAEIVGVFKGTAQVDAIHSAISFDRIQVHGDGPLTCAAPLIRVVKPDELDQEVAASEGGITLIDGSEGRGIAFDWSRVRSRAGRFVIAGGLEPENVGEAITTARPFGVDVSSGVESSPGRKDPARIVRFVEAVRRADADHR